MTEDPVAVAYVLFQPTRFKILRLLYDTDEPIYISKIADRLGIDHKLAAFHLVTLSQHGLVHGEYGLENPPHNVPKAVKYYSITDAGKELLKKFLEVL